MKGKTATIKSIIFSKIKRQLYKLNFAVTSACNSRCKTCNVWKVFQKTPQIAKKDLSLGEVKLIFKNLPPDFVWLSLSGGEPFLRGDLVDICQAAAEEIPSLKLISIPSNGLLTAETVWKTKKILSFPLKNLYLNFSIDGPEVIHDQIRGMPGGFRKTWRTYEEILALSQKEPRLNVNLETTISKSNLDYLEGFFKRLIADGHKITLTLAQTGYLYKNENQENNFTKLNRDGEKVKKVVEVVKEGLSFISPMDLIQRVYLSKVLKFYRDPEKHPLPCIALRGSLALDAQGNISPCFIWGKVIGNLRDFNYDLKRFLDSKESEVRSLRELIKNGGCPNCWTPCEAYQSIISAITNFDFPKLVC